MKPTLLLVLFGILGSWFSVLGQSTSQEQPHPIVEGLKSSFAVPWRDLLVKKHPSEWRNLLDRFSVSLSTGYPLSKSASPSQGSGSDGTPGVNQTLNATVKYSPFGAWFGQVTYYHYLSPELQKSWSPDFSYGFGYSDWRPYTLGLTYANFGGNRISPNREAGEKHTNFRQGTFTLSWKFKIPDAWERAISVSPSGGFGGNLALKLTPSFTHPQTQMPDEWKKVAAVSFKYTIHQWFYVNANFNYYLDPDHQQPWDPDFTYGFGYFDWHPGTISIQYNNYSGNRFPGRDHASGTGVFESGGLSLSWGWSF